MVNMILGSILHSLSSEKRIVRVRSVHHLQRLLSNIVCQHQLQCSMSEEVTNEKDDSPGSYISWVFTDHSWSSGSDQSHHHWISHWFNNIQDDASHGQLLHSTVNKKPDQNIVS